jgi:hypothetical protein
MAVTPSGKDKLLKWMRVYMGGYDISGDLRTFGSIENGYEGADMLGVSETTRNYLAGGNLMTSITGLQILMNDTASSGAFTLLKSAPKARKVSFHFGGGAAPAVGDPAYVLSGVHLSDAVAIDQASGVLTAPLIYDTRTYSANYTKGFGVVLRGNTSITASLGISSSTSVDQGAQTTNGWAAIMHVIATSSGNYSCEIQDSSDDSAFGNLGTFTADGSTLTSELLTGSGTVERYVAFKATRTAGSFTAIVAFMRG